MLCFVTREDLARRSCEAGQVLQRDLRVIFFIRGESSGTGRGGDDDGVG